jgi:hypothetical protein
MKMNVPYLLKYHKTAKVMSKILNVCYWIFFSLTVFSFLLFVGSKFFPTGFAPISLNSNGTLSISPDQIIQFRIPAKDFDGVNLNSIFSSFLVAVSFALLLITNILKQLKDILKNVVDNAPFHEKNAKNILHIGYTFIAGSVCVPVSKAYVINKIIHAFDLNNMKAVYTVNVELLFIGILLILLSAIFHYGAYLQQEYDTTL